MYVFEALSRHFSHGWSDAYPPVHFYLLGMAASPLLLLNALDRITFDGAAYTLFVVIARLVSIVMAAGIVAAACVCGTRAFGRRAGLIAAALVAVTTPFVYNAKTANVDVPYLFWLAMSMVCYLACSRTGARGLRAVCRGGHAVGLHQGSGLRSVPAGARRHRRTDMASDRQADVRGRWREPSSIAG